MSINDKIKLLNDHSIKYFIGRDSQTHTIKLYIKIYNNGITYCDVTQLNKKQMYSFLGYSTNVTDKEYAELCYFIYDRL